MRADVWLLLHGLFDDPGRDRTWFARHGDGALFLSDVRVGRVAWAVRNWVSERLLRPSRGQRGRGDNFDAPSARTLSRYRVTFCNVHNSRARRVPNFGPAG